MRKNIKEVYKSFIFLYKTREVLNKNYEAAGLK